MTPTKDVDEDLDQASARPDEWAEHERTYKGFVRGVIIFAAHVLVVLLILGWVFSDSFNTPPIAG